MMTTARFADMSITITSLVSAADKSFTTMSIITIMESVAVMRVTTMSITMSMENAVAMTISIMEDTIITAIIMPTKCLQAGAGRPPINIRMRSLIIW